MHFCIGLIRPGCFSVEEHKLFHKVNKYSIRVTILDQRLSSVLAAAAFMHLLAMSIHFRLHFFQIVTLFVSASHFQTFNQCTLVRERKWEKGYVNTCNMSITKWNVSSLFVHISHWLCFVYDLFLTAPNKSSGCVNDYWNLAGFTFNKFNPICWKNIHLWLFVTV